MSAWDPSRRPAAGADLIWGVTPFGQPCAPLVIALARAGAFGVLDVATGCDIEHAHGALAAAAGGVGPQATFGIRIAPTSSGSHRGADVRTLHGSAALAPDHLPPAVRTVVIAAGSVISSDNVARWQGREQRRVVVEVTSLEAAQQAVGCRADGLIAKGAESAGRVGEVGAFVLLQQLTTRLDLPVWCQGGMGLYTAAAAIAGGATGVVFDTQLGLVNEMVLPALVRAAIGPMDGAETTVVGGHRVYARPDVAAVSSDADPEEVAPRLGLDLQNTLLPVGQDTAFAAPLATRFHTAGGVMHAVRTGIGSQLRGAAVSNVLGPGSAFAEAFNLRYPIAQGPMTRVSDQPEFAAAVAGNGGLPFLALALMAPDAARELLEKTQASLAGRTWGVGILGFVPPELRSGQLAAVLAVRPPVALIAGGRPSLARPLEEAGIATFLHVPSPGLLELFVREGARRFVFEGRECGGHVGPRSSFVLWEQQVTRLLQGNVEGMDVLFAGGIHDARSAAMVAAVAAPLAERGARIGVLMGTAYLFTEEAVATGAIKVPFQEAAVACQRTALLETAPGHTTRCADTTFVGRFNDERRALEAAGLSGPDRWAALEDLNLGRLRIAAKGLRREGDQVVDVDEDEQRRDGLYMIGDVATLRDAATTIAALHEAVSVGSGAVLAAAAVGVATTAPVTPPMAPADVAVIGMACRFPGAEDAAEYWGNIVAGTNHVREVPAQRWDPAIHCSAEAIGPNGTVSPSRWGGFLEPTPFNPMKYGIPPSSLGAIEPVQLLSLEVAANALADAGYSEREFDRSRTSVFFGVEGASDLSNAYVFRALVPSYLGSMPTALDEHLPALTEDSFPGVLSNVIAGRIANRLDLGGANFSVDAACAASLAAVNMACQELVTGGSDMVVCGGADLHNGVYDYQLFASVGALSPTGSCKSFDEGADGIALGEGVAVVVLKRLADAARDGDRIYAVIKGVGASSDGRSLGLTAPRGEGQRAALSRAYERAGVAPATVGMVEAHGTGTVVGDRTELSALTDFFSEAGRAPGSCALGSVKAQIGHTKCAAGMAGMIKVILALHHAVRPPTAHIKRPSAGYDIDTSPFSFSGTARPWPAKHRTAGVSAFGFGGSNFHVVVDSYDECGPSAHGLDQWPAELFAFRGAAASLVEEQMAALGRRLDERSGARLRDLARHVWDGCSGPPGTEASGLQGRPAPIRLAIVATSLDDLKGKLALARSGQSGPGVYRASGHSGPVGLALLFPGQGSQRPAMLADLFVTFPGLHEFLRLGDRYHGTMFPATSADPDRTAIQRAAITDTRVAQPTLGMAGLAVARLLCQLGVQPDALGGHSYGEIVALCAAGVFPASDLLRLSEQRARAMTESSMDDPGAMAAVTAPADQVMPLLDPWPALVVANDNSPRQVVISGPTADVAAAAQSLSGRGLSTRVLPVACGFHSPLMAAAAVTFARAVGDVAVAAPAVPVWSNQTASPYPNDSDGITRLLAAQVDHPVRFREQIESMYDAGIRVFVEAGPGRVLTGLVGQILGVRPHQAIAIDAPGMPGVKHLLHALALLAVAGVPLALTPLFEGREIAGIGARQGSAGAWTIDGHLVRGPDGRPVPGGLRSATEIPVIALGALAAPVAPPAPAVAAVEEGLAPPALPVPAALLAPTDAAPLAEGDPVMLEYLRGLGQMVTAGHDVMARYLDSRSGQPLTTARAAVPAVPIAGVPDPPISVGRVAAAAISDLTIVSTLASPTEWAIASRPATITGAGGGGGEPMVPVTTGGRSTVLGGPPSRDVEPASARPEVMDHPSVPPLSPEELLAAIVAVVSERTGYPPELLGADLDLEADLSIDSIKRIEIVGDLAIRVGLAGNPVGGLDDAMVEQLTTLKTLTAIVEWILGHASAPNATTSPAPLPPPVVSGARAAPRAVVTLGATNTAGVPARTGRFVQRVEPTAAPGANPDAVAGRRFFLSDDGDGIAPALAALLEERGAQACVGSLGQGWSADGFVHLASLSPAGPSPAEVFGDISPQLGRGLRSLLLVTGMGGSFGREVGPITSSDLAIPLGAGLRGMAKSLAREYPEVGVRTVDLDVNAHRADLARQLLTELLADDPLLEVGYRGGSRWRLRTVPEPLVQNGTIGIRPERGDVVLLTGGGRGITAAVAVALGRHGCHVELVGRTRMPDGQEDAAIASCRDDKALRRLVSATTNGGPVAIEATCARILAQRQLRATLAAITAAGGSATYHALDVRDGAAMAVAVDDIYRRHGRLDGIIHGAGIVEDRLAPDKTVESFARVYDTKVAGARALLAAIRPGVRFVVLFGSVAGAFGNRGQVDYAAANEALEALAWAHNGGPAGRVVCIHWGPWGGAGMVSPGLEREFTRQGIGLIDPDEGTATLLRELALGPPAAACVVVMRGQPDLFGTEAQLVGGRSR